MLIVTAYRWGIKPPYPTEPVPPAPGKRKTEEKPNETKTIKVDHAPAMSAKFSPRASACVHVAGRENCRLEIPPHARRKSPSSTSLSPGGAGEWSLLTNVRDPFLMPSQSLSRFSASLIGGAHL